MSLFKGKKKAEKEAKKIKPTIMLLETRCGCVRIVSGEDTIDKINKKPFFEASRYVVKLRKPDQDQIEIHQKIKAPQSILQSRQIETRTFVNTKLIMSSHVGVAMLFKEI